MICIHRVSSKMMNLSLLALLIYFREKLNLFQSS